MHSHQGSSAGQHAWWVTHPAFPLLLRFADAPPGDPLSGVTAQSLHRLVYDRLMRVRPTSGPSAEAADFLEQYSERVSALMDACDGSPHEPPATALAAATAARLQLLAERRASTTDLVLIDLAGALLQVPAEVLAAASLAPRKWGDLPKEARCGGGWGLAGAGRRRAVGSN